MFVFIADFYNVLGLRPAPCVAAPDHIVTQLEFLSSVRYLQENAAAESERQCLARLERDFLERHLLSWLPVAQAKLEELNPPLFPALFGALARFLFARAERT